MSTESSSGSSASSILKPVAGALVIGGGVVVGGSAVSDPFRETVEQYVPGAHTLLSYIVPRATAPPLVVDEPPPSVLEPVIKEDEPVELIDPVESEEPVAAEPEVAVEVSEEVEADDVTPSEETPLEEVVEVVVETPAVEETAPVMDTEVSDAAVVEEEVITSEAEAEVLKQSEVHEETVEVEEPVLETETVEETSSTVTAADVAEEEEVAAVVESIEEPAAEVETEYVVVEVDPVDAELSKQQALQQQLQILLAEHENLRIILDDTITTKSSAIRMLNGYIGQYSQALLVAQADPAYSSIWDAISAVDHSIRESMDLVTIKEGEVQTQVKSINALVSDIRTHEKEKENEIADKAEQLISTSSDQLATCQTELDVLRHNVEVLRSLRQRIEASPDKLQNYLRGFVPDLIKLMALKEGVDDVGGLSGADALLLLSLNRPVLLHAQQEVRDAEKRVEFETLLEQQKEEVKKEAQQHFDNVLQTVVLEKEEELNVRVEEVQREHTDTLAQELHLRDEAHKEHLRDEADKLQTQLQAQFNTQLHENLQAQAQAHEQEVRGNMSTLSGIESKIGDVLNMEKTSHKHQQLWAAVHMLYNALSTLDKHSGRTKQLVNEVSDIVLCDEEDPLLVKIVSTLPDRAKNTGIVPETVLTQEFREKKRLCMRVAAVQDGSSSFFTYAFSYIKSFFVVTSPYRGQMSDEVSVDSLNAYEILEKAEYCVQRGDLEQAAKFMSQLNGVARKLCATWVDEVRLLLETKQSVNLLMAYVGSLIAGYE